ncbi:MAG: sugar transferase, partial [Pseudomonadota bacterium]
MEKHVCPNTTSRDLDCDFDTSETVYTNWAKRLLDVVFSILLLPILVPVIFVLYAFVRASGGPGFFGHLRMGKDGRSFRCWKLRTM